jgi:hypothetical protein
LGGPGTRKKGPGKRKKRKKKSKGKKKKGTVEPRAQHTNDKPAEQSGDKGKKEQEKKDVNHKK